MQGEEKRLYLRQTICGDYIVNPLSPPCKPVIRNPPVSPRQRGEIFIHWEHLKEGVLHLVRLLRTCGGLLDKHGEQFPPGQ